MILDHLSLASISLILTKYLVLSTFRFSLSNSSTFFIDVSLKTTTDINLLHISSSFYSFCSWTSLIIFSKDSYENYFYLKLNTCWYNSLHYESSSCCLNLLLEAILRKLSRLINSLVNWALALLSFLSDIYLLFFTNLPSQSKNPLKNYSFFSASQIKKRYVFSWIYSIIKSYFRHDLHSISWLFNLFY